MIRSLALALSLLTGLGSASAGGNDDAARLVPADATVLVRFESLGAVLDLVHAFGPLGGEPVASLDAPMLLGGMGFPGDADALDPARALWLAVEIDPNAPAPVLTWVVPVKDAAAFQAALAGMPMTYATLGSYVGVSTHAGYATSAPSASASPLAAQLRPGIVAAHVDLQALIGMYRPLLDMGLAQAESSFDAAAAETLPLDIAPLLTLYLGGLRTALDCAEALGLAVTREGDELGVQLDFRARAESALDGWELGAPADLAGLARYIDPACDGQIVMAADWKSFYGRFAALFESVVAACPDPLRGELARLVADQTRFVELLEPGVATSFETSESGFSGSYVLRSSKPEKVVATFAEMAQGYEREGGLVRLHDAGSLELDGLVARTWQVTIDYQALQAALTPTAPEGDEVPELAPLMEALYGKDIRIGMAHRDGVVLFAFAGGESALRAGLERLVRPGTAPARLLRLIEHTGGGTPSFAYHVDFGQAMSEMAKAMDAQVPGQSLDLPELSFPMDVWGAIRGRTWSGGFATSITELLEFARSMQK